MNKKTRIVIIGAIAVFAGIFFGYVRKSSAPRRTENEIPAVSQPAPKETPDGLIYRQINLPPITLQEFAAPNFIASSPTHKEALSLTDLKEVRLKFSERIEAPSKIFVLSANKVVGQGNTTSSDAKELFVPLDIGSFSARTFQDGIYEVYYDACFVGDMCYKGQYAFYGVGVDS
ncbi:MAG: hypothetical protein Q7S09_00600 [bacterium]|nr:hypothetical protein [bacterium]